MSIEYSAFESGLDRFIKLDKETDFLGKSALKKSFDQGNKNRFITLEIIGTEDADARGSEGIFKDGKLVGRVTSGGFGFRINRSLALGIVKSEFAEIDESLKVEILGKKYKAEISVDAPFDPSGSVMRG